MSRTLNQRFAKTRTFVIALSSFAIFSIGHMFYDLTGKYKKTGQVQNGLQICTNRAGQTYTATVIGDAASMYLESNFTGATSECFAEVTSIVEASKFMSGAILKKLNTLNSNVHWFHESLRSTGNGFNIKEGDNTKNISSKFATVEKESNSIGELVDAQLEDLNNSLFNLKLALFLAGSSFILMGVWEIVERRKLKQQKTEIEDEALSQLISEDHATATRVEEIIVNALDLNEMVHCSKLLTTYRQNVLKSYDSLATYTPAKELREELINKLPTPMTMVTSNKEVSEERLEKIWNDADHSVDNEIKCEVESIATKIIDHLSNKLIADGIMVDMNVNESMVAGDAETIEQILYQVISDSIKNSNTSENKKVQMNGKLLGSIYTLELLSYGNGREGLDQMVQEITKELLNDINGRLEVSNVYDQEKLVIGRRVRIILKTTGVSRATVEEHAKTLTRVEKGSKKEILDRIAQMQN